MWHQEVGTTTGYGIAMRKAIVPLVLLLLTACRDGEETRQLRVWALGREGETVRDLVRDFAARNPGIEVRVQQIPWSAAREKLLTAYAAKTLPDVFQLGNTWIPEFTTLHALEDLTERFTHWSGSEDFFPATLDANRIEGRLYGVPWYIDTRVLFYRRDLLAQAGWSESPTRWDEWKEALRRIRAHCREVCYGVFLPVNEWEFPVLLALQGGALLLRENATHGDFTAPVFRDAFSFYTSLFREGLAPLSGTQQVANFHQEFALGRFAFYLSGPWNLGEFRRRLPADLERFWATAPLPSFDSHSPGLSLAGGASLVVSAYSSHKGEAWQLIEHLLHVDSQVEMYRRTGDLPARRSAWQDPLLAEDAKLQPFRSQMQRMVAPPRTPEWERIAARIALYGEKAARGELPEEDVLEALNRDVETILEKRRWLLQRP
jgi:multiple sugar transport system substrate-binding protein